MNISKTLIAVITVVLVAVFWFSFTNKPVKQVSPVTLDSRISRASPQQVELAVKLQNAAMPQMQMVAQQEKIVFEEKLLVQKEEIDRNIALLNQNLSDRQQREAIQDKLALLIEEYNQTALPLLLSKLTASNE